MLREPLQRHGHQDKQSTAWSALRRVHAHPVHAEDDQKHDHLRNLADQSDTVWRPAIWIDPRLQPRERIVAEPLLKRGFATLVLVLAEIVQLLLGEQSVAERRNRA